MNGTGVKGGAFGFRVSSINKVNHPAFLVQKAIPELTFHYAAGRH